MIFETAITLILVFGILVIFHELGHFTIAKLVGIRVEEFAVGFGPKLVRLFKKGDTEYTIRPFPIGGFVKLAGMEPGEEDIADGFQAQAIWKRALVIFAGPFASFLLAVLVFVGMGVFFGFPDTARPQNRVGVVFPQTEAARIGLRSGDHILEINGKKISQGTQLIDVIHNSPGKEISLRVQHNGQKSTKIAVPRWQIIYGGAIWSFMKGDKAAVEDVYESGGKKPDLQPKDELVSINGQKISSGQQMVDAVKRSGNKPAQITVKRDGSVQTVSIKPSIQFVKFAGVKWAFPGAYAAEVDKSNKTPFKMEDQIRSIGKFKIKSGEDMIKALSAKQPLESDLFKINRRGKDISINLPAMPTERSIVSSQVYDARGLIGFMPESDLVKTGFVKSVETGLAITGNIATQLVQTLTTKRIKDEVGGPLMIAQATASSVARGPYAVLTLLGGLSMSLAFINMIPIPVVDGGHLALLLIEAIRRKRLTREQMQAVTMAGIVILGAIFVLVISSDIFKLSKGLVPQ